MSENEQNRSKIWTPLLYSLVLVIGMILGFNLKDTLRNKRDLSTVIQRNDRLEEIIELIKQKYVDTINTNLLYEDAVTGLLTPLDPHTVYIPADELQEVNNDLDGGFSGIGVEFSILKDTVEVTSVVENGPASKAGITAGDKIIRVGDSLVAGTGITSDRIISLLRGKQNSTIQVTMKLIESGTQKKIPITRDIIPIYSVDASVMADNKTGYIKINRFSATTYDEFAKALSQLKKEGASQLILDLRDNPGGYLNAATSILDDLIADEKLLVYTKGRNSARIDYKAGEHGEFEEGRIAILVDENSASASEIIAGAIQDWDRGVIVGRRTYGKGLVQEQYEMPDGAALRLTTAKYYTPSGRSIQRSYAEGRDAYQEDYAKRYDNGELTGNDIVPPADSTPYYTVHKRVVYGGGGIKPDVYVPYDTSKWSTPLLNIAFSQEMRNVIWAYYLQNRNTFNFKNIADFTHSFKGEGQVINKFVALLPPGERKTLLKQFTAPMSQRYFEMQIKAQIARFLFRDNGYYSVKLQDDNVVNKALEVLNTNRYSQILGK
jgi:carboxyl-terminal processing protease